VATASTRPESISTTANVPPDVDLYQRSLKTTNTSNSKNCVLHSIERSLARPHGLGRKHKSREGPPLGGQFNQKWLAVGPLSDLSVGIQLHSPKRTTCPTSRDPETAKSLTLFA
jgi:hypothetical protein